jgi:DNA-directed RNA polymerase specialized sigma24 family protein
LQRLRPALPVDHLVLSVLIDASRILRAGEPPTPERITSAVLECTRTAAEQLPSSSESPAAAHATLSLKIRSELVNALFSRLSREHREILLRCFLLNRSDDEISQEMSVSIEAIRLARRTAREQFQRMSDPARPS